MNVMALMMILVSCCRQQLSLAAPDYSSCWNARFTRHSVLMQYLACHSGRRADLAITIAVVGFCCMKTPIFKSPQAQSHQMQCIILPQRGKRG